MATKNIKQSRLDIVRDLIGLNVYNLTENDDPQRRPVMDLLLENSVWNNTLYSMVSQITNALDGPLGEWRLEYVVRKRKVAAGEPAITGPQKGGGSIINDKTPTYFVIIAGDKLDVRDSGREIVFPDFSRENNYPREIPAHYAPDSYELYTESNKILIDDYGFNQKAQAFREELKSIGDRRAFLMNTVDTEETRNNELRALTFGPFGVDVTVYVCFPKDFVIDYPFWFFSDFEEVGTIEIVDREKMVGGEAGGLKMRLHSGGHSSYIKFPGFVDFALRGSDPARDPDDPEADRTIHFDITPSVEGGFWHNLSGGSVIRHLRDVKLNVPANIGGIKLQFMEYNRKPAIILTIKFETGGPDEIRGEDGVDFNLSQFNIVVYLFPEVREHRLYWSFKIEADVKAALDAIQNAVKDAIEDTLEEMLDKNSLTYLASLLFSLPLNDDPHEVDVNTGLNFLIALLDTKNPDFPCSLFPSNIGAILPNGSNLLDPEIETTRILDRFVRYESIKLGNDPDERGAHMMAVHYDLFEEHGEPRRFRLNTAVIPREMFELRPLRVRLVSSKAYGSWDNFAGIAIDGTMNILRKTLPYIAQEFLPKLHLEYEVYVHHDLLPRQSSVYKEKSTHILAKTSYTPWFLFETSDTYYFHERVLAPPTFETIEHYLELPSVVAKDGNPDNDVIKGARIRIRGKAKLVFWVPKPEGGRLGGMFDAMESHRASEAREEGESDSGEDTGQTGYSRARVNSMLTKVETDLGDFRLERPMSEISGLGRAEPGESNQMTAEGEHIHVDYYLDRTSVDPDIYDWLNIRYQSFKLTRQGHVGKNLVPGEIFDVVAYVQGEPLNRSRYYLAGGGRRSGRRLISGRLMPLEGGQWSLTAYSRKDDPDATLNLRFEVIKEGVGVIAAVEQIIKRKDIEGRDWEDQKQWGIPAGESATVIWMANGEESLEVECELQNKLFNSSMVPMSHIPKTLNVKFNNIKVHDDEDPLGEGELRFWASLHRQSPPDDRWLELDSRSTHTRGISSGRRVSAAMGPITKTFKPLDELKIKSHGRDYDSPGFPWYDNHDSLRTSTEQKKVEFNDDADGRIQTRGGNYDLSLNVKTISLPVKPDIQIFHRRANRDNTKITLERRGEVDFKLRVRASWLNSLKIRIYRKRGDSYPHHPSQVLDIPAPKPLNHYDRPLEHPYSLRFNNQPAEDFVYYADMSLDISNDVEIRLLAENAAGAIQSSPVNIEIED